MRKSWWFLVLAVAAAGGLARARDNGTLEECPDRRGAGEEPPPRMNVRRRWWLLVPAAVSCLVWALPAGASASRVVDAPGTGSATYALVSVGSPTNIFPRNEQDEPAIAVDPLDPSILAADTNDNVDNQPCSKLAATTEGSCFIGESDFNLGVGETGMYFSFDSGHNWIQPTYQGLTAAGCDPTVEPCTPVPGPINTIPNYYQNGLRTRGDPSVAFGPAPGSNGTFSYANGVRTYFSNLATNLTDTNIKRGGINSNTAVAVSYIDNPTPTRVADQSNWSAPVLVAGHDSTRAFPNQDEVWADNASSSPYFGHVYDCYNDFHSNGRGHGFPLKPTVAVSVNGGLTWQPHQVSPATTASPQGYDLGCTVRTDSHGNVYAFFGHGPGNFPGQGVDGGQMMIKSADGGATWGTPVEFMQVNTACFFFDPIFDRCAMDGPSGARRDLAPMASISIANGAPTGADATNEIVDTWTDGRSGQNHEVAMLSYSTDGGTTWSTPQTVSLPGDRAIFAAPAIAPDGSRVYVSYNAFTVPFATDMSTLRREHGVMRSAVIGAGGAPAGWTTDFVGPSGDVRGTSPGDSVYSEFLGDYVYAVATRTYGIGVWTDVPDIADCPAIDAWRQASASAGTLQSPAPWPLAACPANFGNSSISSATTAP